MIISSEVAPFEEWSKRLEKVLGHRLDSIDYAEQLFSSGFTVREAAVHLIRSVQ